MEKTKRGVITTGRYFNTKSAKYFESKLYLTQNKPISVV